MPIDVRSSNEKALLGYLDLADNHLPPATTELRLPAKPPGKQAGDGKVTVAVTFRKTTADVGKWIAWADTLEEMDPAEGHSRAGSKAD